METTFPRIPGDIGNANTFPFPVLYKIVKGASPERVVGPRDQTLLEAFIQAGKELEAQGVKAITTSCGFMILYQKEIAQSLSVPFFSSSLLQVPLVHKIIGDKKKIGIITYDSQALTEEHLKAAGIDKNIPLIIAGMEKSQAFAGFLKGYEDIVDIERCTTEHVTVAQKMRQQDPSLGAIVLECTNMPPYSYKIQDILDIPVFDIITLVNWVYHGLSPIHFRGRW